MANGVTRKEAVSRSLAQRSASLIPSYVPLPLDAIKEAGDVMEKKQLLGMQAVNEYQVSKHELMNKVLPFRRNKIEESFSEVDQTISNITASGDYKHVRPALLHSAELLRKKVIPYANEYALYNETNELAKEMLQKGDITINDYIANVIHPLEDLKSKVEMGDETATYTPGFLAPRMNVGEELGDFVKEYNRGSVEQIRMTTINGVPHYYTETVKGITDPAEFVSSLRSFLTNNPSFNVGINNDVKVQMRNMSVEDKENAKRQIAKTFEETRKGLLETVADKASNKKELLTMLDKKEAEFISNPDAYIEATIRSQAIDQAISPYLSANLTEPDISISNLTTDPKWSKDYQYSLDRQLAVFKKKLEESSSDPGYFSDAGSSVLVSAGVNNLYDLNKKILRLEKSNDPKDKAVANYYKHLRDITFDNFLDQEYNFDGSPLSKNEVKKFFEEEGDKTLRDPWIGKSIAQEVTEKGNFWEKVTRTGLRLASVPFYGPYHEGKRIITPNARRNDLIKERFKDDNKSDEMIRLLDKYDEYVATGADITDRVYVPTGKNQAEANRLWKVMNPRSWAVVSGDEFDFFENAKDYSPAAVTQLSPNVPGELMLIKDDETKQVVRVISIDPRNDDFFTFFTRGMGNLGEGLRQQRPFSQYVVGKDYSEFPGLPGVQAKAYGSTGKLTALANGLPVTYNDFISLAEIAPQEQANALIQSLAFDIADQTNLPTSTIIRGIINKDLSPDVQSQVDSAISQQVVFRNAGDLNAKLRSLFVYKQQLNPQD